VAGEVRLIRPEDRTRGAATPGMTREQAVATDGLWAGVARTEAGRASGWHHHGAYESTIYVLSGVLRMEFGPGGPEVLEAGPATSCTWRPAPSIGRAIPATRSAASWWSGRGGASRYSTWKGRTSGAWP
jgi:hypothetical protein